MSVKTPMFASHQRSFAILALRRLVRRSAVRQKVRQSCVPSNSNTIGIGKMRTISLLALLIAAIGTPVSTRASELTAAFEATCLRTPEIHTLMARRAEIDAKARATEALLPGGPWATVLYRDDALTTGFGLKEYRAEFDVPIWLHGERGAALAAALTEGERIEAELAARRLVIAQRVRRAYWIVAEARAKVSVALRRRTTAMLFVKSVRLQDTAGQAFLVDSKMADADVRDADVSVVRLNTYLEQAQIAFGILTGLQAPFRFSEAGTKSADPSSHPRLILRRAANKKALADEHLAWTVDRDRPSIGVFSWNVDSPGNQPNNHTIGVRARIPFAYDAINEPKRAIAAAAVVGAREELALAEREVRGEVDQAAAGLDGARKQLSALDARLSDLKAVVTLSERAQRAGQVPLNDVIRVRLTLFEAELARVTGQIAVERAQSELRQALGFEP